jgi:two-component system chemotaxis sensor kinase CheA
MIMNETTKKLVLLAEDDNSMRRFIEIILQQAGYEVLAAEDGLEATKIALENDVDAVIADAIMPNLSGYDLCRMLRANPEKSHVPLIILSGLEPADPDKPAEHLADIFLTKGTDLKENLLTGLKKLL